jgi:hypothetical protein
MVTGFTYHSSSIVRKNTCTCKEDVLCGIVALPHECCQTVRRRDDIAPVAKTLQTKHAGRFRRMLASLLDALLAREGVAAYIPITLITISIFIGSSWQVFLPTTDPSRYQCYALTFWFGSGAIALLPAGQCSFLQVMHPQPPFHMLPIEYPPLTLLPFSLALLAPLHYYQVVIALMMALVAVLIYWLLLRYGPRGAALAFALSLFVGALGTAQGRFDLIPAALTLLCVIAAERKQWRWAYIALAFGVLFKLYPILLLPALFIAEQRASGRFSAPPQNLSLRSLPQQLWYTLHEFRRWRWKNTLLCLGILAGVTGLFALLNFQGAVVNQLVYFLQRPVQVEATGSTLLWLTQGLGFPLSIDNNFGSLNVVSGLNGVVSLLGTLCLAVGCLAVLWMQWRGRLDFPQATIGLLLVFITTGKVFSPQYLMWLMPLLAYAGAFDAFWIFCWGAASVLTTYVYTYLYTRPVTDIRDVPLLPGFMETVGIRNALFVLMTLAFLCNWFQSRQRRALPPVPEG